MVLRGRMGDRGVDPGLWRVARSLQGTGRQAPAARPASSADLAPMGITPDCFVKAVIAAHIDRELKGKLRKIVPITTSKRR